MEITSMELQYLNENKLEEFADKSAFKLIHKDRNIKELYTMTEEELKNNIICALNNKSESTINSYLTYYRKYFNWLKDDKKIDIEFDYDSLLSDVKNYIKIKSNMFSRKEVYDFATKCKNSQDAIIIVLMFEGVEKSELMGVEKTDLSGTRLKINSNYSIELPKDAIDLFNKASMQKSIPNKLGEYIPLHDSNKLIRNTINKEIKNSKYINERLKKIKCGDKAMNDNNLKLSGKMFYLSVIEQLKNELTDLDYKNVYKKYTKKEPSDSKLINLKKEYRKYKESNYYEEIDTDIYYNIYSDIMNNQNINMQNADKELGEMGERYFYEKLIKVYGEGNVLDETKNGVGYDFSVNINSIKYMYEVKSTRIDEKDTLKFHLTIKELMMAFKHKNNFFLSILYYKHDNLISNYIITNPIENLEIKEQANKLIELYNEEICIPIDIRLNIPFDKIKKFKTNKFM